LQSIPLHLYDATFPAYNIASLVTLKQFEITPAASSTLIPFLSSSRLTTNPPPPTKPVHVYLDLLNTGLISLTPPKTASTGPAGAIKVRSRPRPGEWVKISLNAKDLVRVAVGEKVPVKLYQNGKLKIKVSVSARGMFFFCPM
jgi:hypothetical protein